MTQELANKIFQSELGQQCIEIFVTSDDQVFIRHEEALLHTKGELIPNSSLLEDVTITTWYEEYLPKWIWKEMLYGKYSLVKYNDKEILDELKFSNKYELDKYIIKHNIQINNNK